MQTGARSGTGGARLADGTGATGIGTVVSVTSDGPEITVDNTDPDNPTVAWTIDEATDWFQFMRHQALLNDCPVNAWEVDFTGESNFFESGTGGTLAYPNTETGGVVELDSTNTPGNEIRLRSGVGGLGPIALIAAPDTESWHVAVRFRWTALADRVFLGIANWNAFTSPIGAQLNAGAGTSRLYQGDGTFVAATYVPAIDGFHDMILRWNPGSGNLEMLIDGSVVATGAVAAASNSAWFIQVEAAGAAAVTIRIDKIAVHFGLAT